MTAREWLREIQNALTRLERSEGRARARRNARADLARTLRGIRAAVNREFPPVCDPNQAPSAKRRRRTPVERARLLLRHGWQIARLGVPVAVVAHKLPHRFLRGVLWVPEWVNVLVGANITGSSLATYARCPERRAAAVADIKLRGETS